jgi:hypothetical protein
LTCSVEAFFGENNEVKSEYNMKKRGALVGRREGQCLMWVLLLL